MASTTGNKNIKCEATDFAGLQVIKEQTLTVTTGSGGNGGGGSSSKIRKPILIEEPSTIKNVTKPRVPIEFPLPKDLYLKASPLKKGLWWLIILIIIAMGYVYYKHRRE